MNPLSPRLATSAAAALLAATLLASCTASSSPGTAQSSPEPTASASASQSSGTPTPDAVQSATQTPHPADATTEPDTDTEHRWTSDGIDREPGQPAHGTFVTDVRTGSHEDFDRVVVEFSGPIQAGWHTSWTDQPVEQGRGQVIDLQGPAFLDVRITGVGIPASEADWGKEFPATELGSTGAIRVDFDGTYEDTAHVVIGMDAQRPYEIFQLEDPARVVIDIRH